MKFGYRILLLVLLLVSMSVGLVAKEIRCGDYFYEINGMEAILMRPASLTQKKYEIPEKIVYEGEEFVVTAIGGYKAFGESKATTIVLPNSIKTIAPYSFYKCKQLKDIVLSSSLTCISWKAFAGCVNLRFLIVPSSVTHVGWGAFMDCERLTTIVFLSPTINFGGTILERCPLLRNIVYASCQSPENWSLAPNTYVPESSKYSFKRSASKGKVIDLVSWDKKVAYSGKTAVQEPSCTSNLKGYSARVTSFNLKNEKGEHCDTIPVMFTNGQQTFTINIPYHYTVQ